MCTTHTPTPRLRLPVAGSAIAVSVALLAGIGLTTGCGSEHEGPCAQDGACDGDCDTPPTWWGEPPSWWDDGQSPDPRTLVGTVTDASGASAAGVLVRLLAIDNAGNEVATEVSAVTDVNGAFAVTAPVPLATGFVVAAFLPDGELRAPALTDGLAVAVHPATEALVTVILDITGAGRSWSELDAPALRSMHDAALAGVPATLDLRDGAAVRDHVRTAVGVLLAESFAGPIAAAPSAAKLGANVVTPGPDFSTLPLPQAGASCNQPSYPLAGPQFVFDIVDDGAVCDGNDGNQFDAFDIAFQLTLAGDAFADGTGAFPAQTTTSFEDGSELVMGPVTTLGGLEVTRKVYVAPDRDVVRYLEIVANPTAAPVVISLEAHGDLGSDENTLLLVSESGRPRVAVGDRFAATLSSVELDPTVGYVWDGGGADAVDRLLFPPQNPGAFRYAWEDVEVPAAGMVVYAHFALLTSERERTLVHAALEEIVARPPLAGMSGAEVRALRNVATTALANVEGEAGAAPPATTLTIQNLTTGGEGSGLTARDGSFALLLEAAAGDTLRASTAAGFSRELVVGPE